MAKAKRSAVVAALAATLGACSGNHDGPESVEFKAQVTALEIVKKGSSETVHVAGLPTANAVLVELPR